jgi:serine/threonine-protein kinase
VCTYQFLTGRLPHEYAALTELALKQQSDEIEPITTYRPEVPPALDDAVRLALRPEPSERYASALQYADAIEAGLRNEATHATIMLTRDVDLDATQALPPDEATQALALDATRPLARDTEPPPALRPPREPARRQPPPRGQPQRRRQERRGFPLGRVAATLAVLVLGAAAAIGLVTATGGGQPEQRIEEADVQRQVDELKDLIERNTQR